MVSAINSTLSDCIHFFVAVLFWLFSRDKLVYHTIISCLFMLIWMLWISVFHAKIILQVIGALSGAIITISLYIRPYYEVREHYQICCTTGNESLLQKLYKTAMKKMDVILNFKSKNCLCLLLQLKQIFSGIIYERFVLFHLHRKHSSRVDRCHDTSNWLQNN